MKVTQTIEQTLFDNHNINLNEWVTDYKECNGLNNDTEVNIDTLYEWIDTQQQHIFDELLNTIIESKYNLFECVIVGSVGRWSGKRQIIPTKVNNLCNAIYRAVAGLDSVIIRLIDGRINIVGYHHDGQNDIDIYLLNKKGEQTENADLSKKCYHRVIKGYLI